MRTPLTRIKLRSEALASACREDPQRAEKFARELDGEVDGPITLANSLLDLARLEEGPESTMTADTLAVVGAALDSCRASAEDKGLTLQVELPESLPPPEAGSAELAVAAREPAQQRGEIYGRRRGSASAG